MPVHVQVGELNARLDFVPNAEWEHSARTYLSQAVRLQQMGRGAEVSVLDLAEFSEAEQDKLEELVRLHSVVGRSIVYYQVLGRQLAIKSHAVDWTLGAPAVELGASTGHEHALFVFVLDAFATAGLKTMQVAALSTCFVGPCLLLHGPHQISFVSLVDLRTGDIVWFNRVLSLFGDVRTPEGAESTVEQLLNRIASDDEPAHEH